MTITVGSPEVMAILKQDKAVDQEEREEIRLEALPPHNYELRVISSHAKVYKVTARGEDEAWDLWRDGKAQEIETRYCAGTEDYETRDLGEVQP